MRGVETLSPSRLRVFAVIPLCALACKRAPATEVTSEAGAANATSAANLPDAGVTPARCKSAERANLHEAGDLRSLVVGDGIATADGFAVGIVHAPASGLEALVAKVTADHGVEEWVVARRGEIVPDAPPPKPLFAANALYAALVARGGPGDAGALRSIVLKKAGAAGSIAAYPEHADESLAFDAALSTDGSRALLVWDEDAVTVGGITVASVLLSGGRAPAPRVVSGDTLDPDGPHVAPRAAGGWWVAWTAHRPESVADAGARAVATSPAEVPAEDRAYSWVEVVTVGDDGAPGGAPRRITSALGHVASFDLAPRSDGELDVVARDETQAREGEGGRVLHVVVHSDGGAGETTVMLPAGAGRGSVDLVTGAGDAAWLTLSDAQDRPLVLPLSPARAPLGAPSIEDALEGGRLLTLATAGPPARFFAAFPAADGALFREVTCAP
jgi:hypothetical protein